MAEKSASRGGSLFKRLIVLVMMLVAGAGIGSWKLKEYPAVGEFLSGLAGGKDSGESSLSELARTNMTQILDPTHDFGRAGMFEVRIDKLTLDPQAFEQGQTIELRVRIRSIREGGTELIVWDSTDRGVRRAVVGRDVLATSWANEPIEIGWTPGDVLEVEVYGRKRFREVVYFRTHVADATSFPLKSGPQVLVNLMPDKRSAKPEGSQVVIESQRIGERPYRSTQTEAQVARENSRQRERK